MICGAGSASGHREAEDAIVVRGGPASSIGVVREYPDRPVGCGHGITQPAVFADQEFGGRARIGAGRNRTSEPAQRRLAVVDDDRRHSDGSFGQDRHCACGDRSLRELVAVPVDELDPGIAAKLEGGKLFAPAGFLAQYCGLDLHWSADAQTLAFTYWP